MDHQSSHPRPDFRRSGRWLDLTGPWQFAPGSPRDDSERLAGDTVFHDTIIVPFPWESSASGVGQAWLADGWYRRPVAVPRAWADERVILHFGGVHHRARVFFNGALVTEHSGVGPFECDLTDRLEPLVVEGEPGGEGRLGGTLVVAVHAPVDKRGVAHGKQRSIPVDDYDACAFQPSSGIWQPVWVEPRPATYLAAVRLEATADLDGFVARIRLAGPAAAGARVEVVVAGERAVSTLETDGEGRGETVLPVAEPQRWSPERPHLYRVTVRVGEPGGDEVTCTAGLRRIEVVGDELHLNGRRCYLRGVLDQGYWPDSGLSAPSVDAIRKDLELARAAGYNLVRKHLKLEDPRFLHLADELGMLVWEEPPSTSRYSPGSLGEFCQGIEQMVERDANHPCIVIWGCFNEEWGLDWRVAEDPVLQEAVADTVARLRALDDTRPVVDNSGWCHVGGDLVDWHYYEPDLGRWAKNIAGLVEGEPGAEIPVPLRPPAIEMKPLALEAGFCTGRPNLNSEYGMGLSSVDRAWHLKWQTQELRRHDRLSGYVYTELYDIEHELAGILTAERRWKDLANLPPAQSNAETVLVLDVLPLEPGIDVQLCGPELRVAVRCSHHGAEPIAGRLHHAWGPQLGTSSSCGPSSPGPELAADPFVLTMPAQIETRLPEPWRAGRLHLWLEAPDGRRLATSQLDVVRKDTPR